MYTPVNPSFTIQKLGVRGYALHGLVFVMFMADRSNAVLLLWFSLLFDLMSAAVLFSPFEWFG